MKITKQKCYKNFNKILKLDKLKIPDGISDLDFDKINISDNTMNYCMFRSRRNSEITAFQDQFEHCSVRYCDECAICKLNNKVSDIKEYINYLRK